MAFVYRFGRASESEQEANVAAGSAGSLSGSGEGPAGRRKPGRRQRLTGATLAEAIKKSARTVGTGFLFAVFGIGALLLAAVLPAMVWLVRGRQDTDLLAQRAIHHAFRLFIWLGVSLRLLGLKETGVERLRGGAGLVVANHPTLLDVVFLISHMPQADCVVKAKAFSNPALRGIVSAAGYVPNLGGESVIDACTARLRSGRSVIVFPEGSRSPAKGLGSFHRGGAHMALASGCSITPVVITCTPPALKRGQPWYRLPNSRLDFWLEVGEPIHSKAVVDARTPRSLAARRLTAELRTHFEMRL
jgi:1-acyl-sn-glycerol-3-phosphate acyltransferase